MSDQDQNAAGSGFGRFVPGFEFLHNLASQAAGGLAQGMGKAAPQLPSLGSWVAPTFNVEDLEKRIEELKAVHFWLDQNSKALAATIQALEVQKMTLATLQTMNLSMGDVANSLKVQATEAMAGFTGAAGAAPEAAPAPAPTQFAGLEIPPRTYGNPASEPPAPAPAPQEKAAAAASETPAPAAPAAGVIDPMQWWGALSQQFQQIASQALQDAARRATPPAGDTPPAAGAAPAPASPPEPSPAPAAQAPRAPAARKKAAPRRRAAAPAPAPAQGLTAGDWPMPGAFFQLPGFPDMSDVGGRKAATPAPAPAKKAAAKKPAAKKAAAKKAPANAPASRRR